MNYLCFGDSNTWGFDADSQCRFPKDIRWAGKLQQYFPFDHISEFGICDMTFGTNDPFYDACNGLNNIVPAIRANSPVDYVIVSLGLNDCKKYLFNKIDTILEDAGKLIYRIQRYSDLNTGCPKVIICGQCTPTEKSVEYYPDEFDSDAIDKAFHLDRKLKEFCKAQKILYCPAPEVIEFCEDGCHYSRQGHELFAQNVAMFIKSL